MHNINSYGYEKINGTKCAVAELKFAEIENVTTTYWIDAQKGTLLKLVNKGIDLDGKEYEYIDEYTATYDIVKDEDVEKPNLEGYTQLENSLQDDNEIYNFDLNGNVIN